MQRPTHKRYRASIGPRFRQFAHENADHLAQVQSLLQSARRVKQRRSYHRGAIHSDNDDDDRHDKHRLVLEDGRINPQCRWPAPLPIATENNRLAANDVADDEILLLPKRNAQPTDVSVSVTFAVNDMNEMFAFSAAAQTRDDAPNAARLDDAEIQYHFAALSDAVRAAHYRRSSEAAAALDSADTDDERSAPPSPRLVRRVVCESAAVIDALIEQLLTQQRSTKGQSRYKPSRIIATAKQIISKRIVKKAVARINATADSLTQERALPTSKPITQSPSITQQQNTAAEILLSVSQSSVNL